MNLARTFLSFVVLGMTASHASAAITISNFEFDMLPINDDTAAQKKNPVCQDFLAYLHASHAKGAFLEDGSLAYEPGLIKSVRWETLNKEPYREGYMQLIKNRGGQGHEYLLSSFEDKGWVLQRTAAAPHLIYFPATPKSGRWLYRLASLKPYDREQSFAESGLPDMRPAPVMLSWFPSDAISWVGDDRGFGFAENYAAERTGSLQWFLYDGLNYSVNQGAIGTPKERNRPGALTVSVEQLELNSAQQTTYSIVCAFRAKYSF